MQSRTISITKGCYIGISIGLIIGLLGIAPAQANEPILPPVTSEDCADVTIVGIRGATGSSGSIESSSGKRVLNYPEVGTKTGYAYSKDSQVRYITNGWEGNAAGTLIGEVVNAIDNDVSISVLGIGPNEGFPVSSGLIPPTPNFLKDLWNNSMKVAEKSATFMKKHEVKCPGTRFYIIGYSMGAMIARHISEIVPELVGGVYVAGDPMQRPDGGTGSILHNTGSDGNGIFRFAWGIAGNLNLIGKADGFYNRPGLSGNRRVICHDDDRVCKSMMGAYPFSSGHQNYFSDANIEVKQEAKDEAIPISNFIVSLINEPPAPVADSTARGTFTFAGKPMVITLRTQFVNTPGEPPKYRYEMWNSASPVFPSFKLYTSDEPVMSYNFSNNGDYQIIVIVREIATGNNIEQVAIDGRITVYTKELLDMPYIIGIPGFSSNNTAKEHTKEEEAQEINEESLNVFPIYEG